MFGIFQDDLVTGYVRCDQFTEDFSVIFRNSFRVELNFMFFLLGFQKSGQLAFTI